MDTDTPEPFGRCANCLATEPLADLLPLVQGTPKILCCKPCKYGTRAWQLMAHEARLASDEAAWDALTDVRRAMFDVKLARTDVQAQQARDRLTQAQARHAKAKAQLDRATEAAYRATVWTHFRPPISPSDAERLAHMFS